MTYRIIIQSLYGNFKVTTDAKNEAKAKSNAIYRVVKYLRARNMSAPALVITRSLRDNSKFLINPNNFSSWSSTVV